MRRIELFPGNAEERAEVRRLTDWFNGKLDREVTRELLTEKVYQRAAPDRPAGARTRKSCARCAPTCAIIFRYVSYLSEARRWLAGDDMSFADLAPRRTSSVLDYLGEVPWGEYPAAKLWYARVKSRPSFRALLADRVPGTAPPRALRGPRLLSCAPTGGVP